MNLASGKLIHIFSPLKVKSPSLEGETHIWPHKNGVQLVIFGSALWHGFGGICYALGYKRGFRFYVSDPTPWGWNQSLLMRSGQTARPPPYFLHLLHEEKEARGSKVMWAGGSCSSGGRAIAPVTWSLSVWNKNSSWSYVCAAKHPFVSLCDVVCSIYDNLS